MGQKVQDGKINCKTSQNLRNNIHFDKVMYHKMANSHHNSSRPGLDHSFTVRNIGNGWGLGYQKEVLEHGTKPET